MCCKPSEYRWIECLLEMLLYALGESIHYAISRRLRPDNHSESSVQKQTVEINEKQIYLLNNFFRCVQFQEIRS